MSAGSNLQEMEVSTKKSVTAVNSGAKPAESMPKMDGMVQGQSASWEDLGGPTPTGENSPLGDSNKLKTPGATLKAVRNVVNKGARSGDPMPANIVGKQASYGEEVESDEELIEEAEEEEEVEKKEKEKGKANKKEKEKKDEDDDMEEEFEMDFSEDVIALVGGEDLSEEFKGRALLIFESAVRTKISEIKESLEVRFNTALVEEVAAIKEELSSRVDSYLEYVAEEWVDQNALQVESGLKGELSESFMTGLKALFEEHYVEIPEDKYDVLGSMVDKLDEMEEKLNEQIDKNVALNRRLAESVADVIFADISEGLALSQKEKLAGLAESVEFESESKYRGKLEALKESYFPRILAPSKGEMLSEQAEEDYGNAMNAYLRAVTKFSK